MEENSTKNGLKMELLSTLHLNLWQWIIAASCGLMVGFSKTGISGVSTLAIPLMAGLFGGKSSAAILLPMLITGDLLAVRHYRKHNNWAHIWRLLPWAFGGLGLGLAIGNLVSDKQFKIIIAISVLFFLVLMIWLERRKDESALSNHWWLTAIVGLAGGFTTMIGNAAGPVMTVYFLSIRLNKYDFISTGAWLFAILNLAKLPLQIFFWKAITPATLAFDAAMIPAIIIGALLGIWVIRWIPEKPFRYIVMVLTAVSAVKLFF
jgi:uncharacterized membrane protein YfcA